jgi:protein tyrosine phosphatase (PTP) superfamily phosphohydrolase (DUF442 family)
MRILLSIGVVFGGLSTAAAQQSDSIRNFLQVNSDFCTGGQPRLEALAALKSKGVRSVLNLRTPGEYREADERAAAERAGLKYFNLPVVYSDPRNEQATEFLRLSDDPANRPMFIHCTAAIRVGAFWLIRRVVRDGWTWDAAIAEARKIGLVNAPHLEEFAKRYIAAHTGSSSGRSLRSTGTSDPSMWRWTVSDGGQLKASFVAVLALVLVVGPRLVAADARSLPPRSSQRQVPAALRVDGKRGNQPLEILPVTRRAAWPVGRPDESLEQMMAGAARILVNRHDGLAQT